MMPAIGFLFWAATAAAHDDLPAPSTATERSLPRIHASGTTFVDEAGTPVRLRGINMGNWLILESWIMELNHGRPPNEQVKDERDLWALLAKRFGAAKARRLAQAHHESWIGHADFVRLAESGFNFVRIPVWHAWLDGDEIPKAPGRDGWFWLDQAMRFGRHTGLRVIVDLHGAPGSQNDWDHSGVAGRNALFKDATYQDRTVALWERIARRYGDDPALLGFDLLNEPRGADPVPLAAFHDRLYKTVRAAAPRSLIFIEDGLHGLNTMPPPSQYGWTNVAYEIHFYLFDAKDDAPHAKLAAEAVPGWRAAQLAFNVPLYLGEFNTINPDWGLTATRRYILAFEANGWAWSPWTYKKIESGSPPSLWGLWRNDRPWAGYANVYKDSYEDLLRYFHSHSTRGLQCNEAYLGALLGR